MITRTRRPSHPAALVREILGNTGITQIQLARALGVSRQTVSEVIRERRPVSADMAVRLSRVFPNQSPDLWLNMQTAVDVWEAEHINAEAYKKIKPLKVA